MVDVIGGEIIAEIEESGLITVEDSVHLECPILTKTRTVIAQKGVVNTLRWVIRDRNGNPIDLTPYLSWPDEDERGQVIFRFKDATGASSQIHQIIGTSSDPVNGVVEVEFSEDLVARAGIYSMNIVVTKFVEEIAGEPVFTPAVMDSGLLSVEPSLFGAIASASDFNGPLTIGEIRIAMRDSAIENQLLDDVEFDDTEIIHAILRPVRYWNEKPPPVAYFTAANFPYRENWLKATVAILMRTAAYWYERNRLPASHGGITVDDMNKSNPYLQISQLMWSEWEDFVITKKVEINSYRAIGSVNSPYC